VCPGCDKAHAFPGTLCESCLGELEEHRKASTEGTPESYVLDYLVFPNLSGTDEDKHDGSKGPMEAMLFSLAQAVTARGHEPSYGHSSRVLPSDAPHRGYAGDRPSGTLVMLTPPQAEELDAFLKRLRDMLERQRRAGRQEGKAVLVGLAQGTLKVSEFEEKVKKWEES
jgi:hypothetical protein